jgi:MTH538 TIR-like domain (DUF1863).
MWPILAAVGIGLLLKEVFSTPADSKNKRKRLFISFAIEDEKYRSFLVAQAKNERSPFTFVDMSVKEPWDENIWKTKCRTKIKSCDGMIILLSNNTWHSSGVRWEIKCAKEEGIPIVGMHIRKNDKSAVPKELNGSRIITWSWNNLAKVIKAI